MDTNAEEVARLPVTTTHKVNRSAFLYHKRRITESHSKIFLTVRCVETNLPNETIQVVQIKNIKVCPILINYFPLVLTGTQRITTQLKKLRGCTHVCAIWWNKSIFFLKIEFCKAISIGFNFRFWQHRSNCLKCVNGSTDKAWWKPNENKLRPKSNSASLFITD
jgi:hypothetical protein